MIYFMLSLGVKKEAAFALSAVMTCVAHAQVVAGQFRYETSGPLEMVVLATRRDSQGNFYIVGQGGTLAPARSAACITEKLSPTGKLLWSDVFSRQIPQECFPSSIEVDSGGQVTIAGTVVDQVSRTDSTFVRHLLNNGSSNWTYIDPSRPIFGGLALDSSGNPITFSGKPSSWFLTKYNAVAPGAIWNHAENIGDGGSPSQLTSDSANHVYALANVIQNGTGGPQVLRFDGANGAKLWSVPVLGIGGIPDFEPHYIKALRSGELLVSGVGHSYGDTRADSWKVGMFSRVSALTGLFSTPSYVGSATGANLTGFVSPIVTDNNDKVYWAAEELYDDNTQANFLGYFEHDGKVGPFVSPFPTNLTDVLVSPAPNGGMFAAFSDGVIPRSVSLIDSTGSTKWSVNPSADLLGNGGSLFTDPDGNLTYINTSVDAQYEHRSGFVQISGSTHALLHTAEVSPIGIRDSNFIHAGVDAAGNTYVVGSENFSPFVAKLSSGGAILWKTYVGHSDSNFGGIAITTANLNPSAGVSFSGSKSSQFALGAVGLDGTVKLAKGGYPLGPNQTVVSTQLDTNGSIDVGLADNTSFEVDQYSALGVRNWKYSVQSQGGGILKVDPLGSIFATCRGWASGTPLFKLSRSGNLLFSNFMPGPYSLAAPDLALDNSSGDIFFTPGAGATYDSTNRYKSTMMVIRLSSGGVERWRSTEWINYLDTPYQGTLIYDPNTKSLYTQFEQGQERPDCLICVSRFAPDNGNILWSNSYDVHYAGKQIFCKRVAGTVDPKGNLLMTANTSFLNQSINHPFLIKFSADGFVRYVTSDFGTYGTEFTQITGLTVGPDNKPLLVGTTPSAYGTGSNNAFSLKIGTLPYAADDAFTLTRDKLFQGNLTLNDEDIVGAACSAVNPPSHAASFSCAPNGLFRFMPTPGYVGTTSFTYHWQNGFGFGRTAKVTLTIK